MFWNEELPYLIYALIAGLTAFLFLVTGFIQVVIPIWLVSFVMSKYFEKKFIIKLDYQFSFVQIINLLDFFDGKNFNRFLELFLPSFYFLRYLKWNLKNILLNILILLFSLITLIIIGTILWELVLIPVRNWMIPVKEILTPNPHFILFQLDKSIYFLLLFFLINLIILAILPKSIIDSLKQD